jgi:hypothetical protein
VALSTCMGNWTKDSAELLRSSRMAVTGPLASEDACHSIIVMQFSS